MMGEHMSLCLSDELTQVEGRLACLGLVSFCNLEGGVMQPVSAAGSLLSMCSPRIWPLLTSSPHNFISSSWDGELLPLPLLIYYFHSTWSLLLSGFYPLIIFDHHALYSKIKIHIWKFKSKALSVLLFTFLLQSVLLNDKADGQEL